MGNELKMNYVDPEEPLHDGIQNRIWATREQMKDSFPDQPERSKREDMEMDGPSHLPDESWPEKNPFP